MQVLFEHFYPKSCCLDWKIMEGCNWHILFFSFLFFSFSYFISSLCLCLWFMISFVLTRNGD